MLAPTRLQDNAWYFIATAKLLAMRSKRRLQERLHNTEEKEIEPAPKSICGASKARPAEVRSRGVRRPNPVQTLAYPFSRAGLQHPILPRYITEMPLFPETRSAYVAARSSTPISYTHICISNDRSEVKPKNRSRSRKTQTRRRRGRRRKKVKMGMKVTSKARTASGAGATASKGRK